MQHAQDVGLGDAPHVAGTPRRDELVAQDAYRIFGRLAVGKHVLGDEALDAGIEPANGDVDLTRAGGGEGIDALVGLRQFVDPFGARGAEADLGVASELAAPALTLAFETIDEAEGLGAAAARRAPTTPAPSRRRVQSGPPPGP